MQLDFDLHQPPEKTEPAEPKVYTVVELTRAIRSLIEERIGDVWVEGEISNLRRQASGHQYFTLKDDSCQLSCVLFGRTAAGLSIKLADGQHVQLFGQLTVYEARGQYQMIVRLAQDRGEGALRAKFEALKLKLAAEGLFAEERKRPLPRFPHRAGLVTSPTGAAIRDFLNVLHRRHPGIEVLINPVRVQGRGAHLEIARAIREFGTAEKYGLPPVDVIVVTRGGGSIEDLWEFNEEAVARAIAESPIPVISAIGHEIDFTIADFAADFRAPTPSAAAEILAAERTEVLGRLARDAERLIGLCYGRFELLDARLEAIRQSPLFREPTRRLQDLGQRLDHASASMTQHAHLSFERLRTQAGRLQLRLAAQSPEQSMRDIRVRCQMIERTLAECATRHLVTQRHRIDQVAAMLHTLNPLATLGRGYTLTTDEDGRVLSSAKNVQPGMTLRTKFHDGESESVVTER